ncbi:MAG: hypothetical protein P4L74_06835 [Candidatus Doudnabacteria bacterium]|nr:hypothetical protein [Candidatus Doudnabacteria bacterium]
MDKAISSANMPHSPLELSISRQLKGEPMPEFSGYLLEKINLRLKCERQLKTLKPKLWLASFVMLSSLALLTFAVIFLAKDFSQSPSYRFLDLVFTDFGVIVANWQDYIYSVLESLPLGALALTLSAGLASMLITDFGVHQWSSFRKISSAARH